jgi:hypothetical protein
MKYIECPNKYLQRDKEVSIFLAGGITNCYDWQKELVGLLSDENYVIYNPRRSNFNVEDDNLKEQIEWEHHYLKVSDLVVFWFAPETLCPISLFEYGKILVGHRDVLLGIHPDYKRKRDLEFQTSLERDITISYNLTDLAKEIKRKVVDLLSYNCDEWFY